MSLTVKLTVSSFLDTTAEVLAVGVQEGPFEKQKALVELNTALGGALLTHARKSRFKGKGGQVLDVPTLGQIGAQRVLLIGTGSGKKVTEAGLRVLAARACRRSRTSESLSLALPDKCTTPGALRALGEGVGLGAYSFTKYLTGSRIPKRVLKSVELHRKEKAVAADNKVLKLGLAVADAVAVARDAVNEPPNELTPEALAAVARGIAKKGPAKIKVLDKKAIAAAGMKLHYAVGQGSENEPRFIHLSYVPKKPKAKIVFVGKGLTFDSGGLSIKPAAGMGDMKSDMGGAAAVLGLMAAVQEVKPLVELHVIVGAAENMPDGSAYRPGDIFGSLDGKTVEIVNTDAEGRLVLADALTYASRLKPDLIVDAATLTGACVVALGKTTSAFYTDETKLVKRFEEAAKAAGENFWRMPLLHELREQLNSDVADLKHTGERWGGSITAALFLKEFVGDVPWMHCDVAAAVLADRARGAYPKGGTGHPVLTFLNFVESFG